MFLDVKEFNRTCGKIPNIELNHIVPFSVWSCWLCGHEDDQFEIFSDIYCLQHWTGVPDLTEDRWDRVLSLMGTMFRKLEVSAGVLRSSERKASGRLSVSWRRFRSFFSSKSDWWSVPDFKPYGTCPQEGRGPPIDPLPNHMSSTRKITIPGATL